jgi:phospholipase/carboxylesterase
MVDAETDADGAPDPHGDQPIQTAGASLEDADAAVVLVHGRGATARGMLQFASEFHREGLAYVAPQAQRGTWYPNRFVAPLDANEPYLSSALRHLDRALTAVGEAGIPPERTLVVGFSQGACLASEYVARNARRYGGLAVLAGGLIGPDGTSRDYEGTLDDTPIFLGVSDDDPHIPLSRAEETVETFDRMGGSVTFEVYEGLGHGIFPDEIEHVRGLVETLLGEE